MVRCTAAAGSSVRTVNRAALVCFAIGNEELRGLGPPNRHVLTRRDAGARPLARAAKVPDSPGVTRNRTRPDDPEPATWTGASSARGVTASGMRTLPALALPGQEPGRGLVERSPWSGVNVTRNVRVCPAWLKSSTDGLTSTSTPGTRAATR